MKLIVNLEVYLYNKLKSLVTSKDAIMYLGWGAIA